MKFPLAVPVLLGSLCLGSVAGAAETVAEKAEALGNDAARAAKKTVHRAQEALCQQGELKCLQQKAEHRLQEAADYTKDKAAEIRNQIDDE